MRRLTIIDDWHENDTESGEGGSTPKKVPQSQVGGKAIHPGIITARREGKQKQFKSLNMFVKFIDYVRWEVSVAKLSCFAVDLIFFAHHGFSLGS